MRALPKGTKRGERRPGRARPGAAAALLPPPRSLLGLTLSLALLGGTGCYHAGNDALARAAQTSFQEASAVASLDEERKQSRSLLERELDALRRETEAERDLALALALDGTWSGAAPSEPPPSPAPAPAPRRRLAVRPSPPVAPPPSSPRAPVPACDVPGTSDLAAGSFLCAINRQLVRVGGRPEGPGGSPLLALRDVRARAVALAARTEGVLRADERSLRLLLPPGEAASLGCPEEGDAAPGVEALAEKRPALKPLLLAYAATCASVQKAHRELTTLPTQDGLLAATQKELSARRALLEKQRADAGRLASDFDKAMSAADEAGQKGQLRGEFDSVRDALGKLSAAASGAAGLAGNRYARLAEAERRHQAVMRIIDAGLAGRDEGGELAVFVRSAGELDDLRHDPSLLLLEAERLRGEVALLRVQIDHAHKQLALLEVRRKALFDQLGELIAAGDAAERAMRACHAAPGDAVAETFARSRDRLCRNAVAGALLRYANAWTVGLLRARVAGRRADGDLHDQGIEEEAVSMRAWEQVLAVPIDAVVRKHAAGIKPGELARLVIEAVGVGALIGIAVPK